MAFAEIVDKFKKIQGVTPRYLRLDAYERMLNGTFYDDLRYPFSQEYRDNIARPDYYIPLLERRPSTPYNMAKKIVDQTAGLLFSSEQFPTIRCSYDTDDVDESSIVHGFEKSVDNLIRQCSLETVMLDIFQAGNVGSCAVILRALDDDLPYIEVVPGKNARPIFDKRNPRKLLAVVQVYAVDAQDLIDDGYENINVNETYWMQIVIDALEERRYAPLPGHEYANIGGRRSDGSLIEWIQTDSYEHHFGRCPAIWVKNLNGGSSIDGPCTWDAVKDFIVEIDYLSSQLGRGLRYSQDPMLAIEQGELASVSGRFSPIGDPDDEDDNSTTQFDGSGQAIKSPTNIITVEGKAKLLEISGAGFDSTGKHLDRLREWALEIVGGMKSSAADQGKHQSGRALEILHNDLLLLVKRQRVAYGNNVLIPLLRLLMLGIANGEFVIPTVDAVSPDVPLLLIWNDWQKPAGSELMNEIQALSIAAGNTPTSAHPLLPRNILVEQAAKLYGLADPNRVVRDMHSQHDSLPQSTDEVQTQLT